MNPIQCTFSYEAGAPEFTGWFIGTTIVSMGDPHDARFQVHAVVCTSNGGLRTFPLERVRLPHLTES